MNVTHLARKCGLSRSTLLYYESIGLMKPPVRTGASYRQYSEADLQRLRQDTIIRYAKEVLFHLRQVL